MSESNNLLYQLIFGEKDSTAHTQRADKHEYLVSVTTQLRDPVLHLMANHLLKTDRRRQGNKFRRLGLKRKKLTSSLFRRAIGSGIKGRPPKHV